MHGAHCGLPLKALVESEPRLLFLTSVRSGAPPLLIHGETRKLVEPRSAGSWQRLDAALFADTLDEFCAVWLHQAFPPPVGEVPSLLLESLARISRT